MPRENTGKILKLNSIQDGIIFNWDQVVNDMNRLNAMEQALIAWGCWVDSNVVSNKTLVFFQEVSPIHYKFTYPRKKRRRKRRSRYDKLNERLNKNSITHVRENQLQLSWKVRLRIAVGIIKGLQYLHFSCSSSVLHYNLKPTNVMFDAEFEPRLADCGLAMLIPNLDRATSGYGTPECFQNCRYTDKSDIFSFGVILGVLLTGRDPMDTFFGEVASGGSLGRWLQHLQQAGEAREALNMSILGEEVEEDEILMAVRIAPLTKLCSSFLELLEKRTATVE